MASGEFLMKRSISAEEMLVFARELRTLVKAKLPLTEGLRQLSRGAGRPGFRAAIAKLAESLEKGKTLSQAVEEQGDVFPSVYRHVLRAGEAGENLEKALDGFIEQQAGLLGIGSRIRAASIYPLVVLVLSVFVFAFMVFVVLPMMPKSIWSGYDRSDYLEYPLDYGIFEGYIHFIYELPGFVSRHWTILSVSLGAAILFIYMLLQNPRIRSIYDLVLLNVPIFGGTLKALEQSRFLLSMGQLLESGVPSDEAARLTVRQLRNASARDTCARLEARLKAGQTLSQAVGNENLFSPYMKLLIGEGEKRGTLPRVLKEAGERYKGWGFERLEEISRGFEPFFMVVVGLFAFALILAFYYPYLMQYIASFRIGDIIA